MARWNGCRRSRVVTLSTVSFSPGYRTEIEPIGRAARERGVFLLADGAQSVGILHTDVGRLGLDGLAVSTQKGLLSLYGLGLLYVRRAWAERLRPASLRASGSTSATPTRRPRAPVTIG